MNGPFHDSKILIAGAHGMVGRALVRALHKRGHQTLLTPSRDELDYFDQRAVQSYLRAHRPDSIIVAAAKVGGIGANQRYPAAFMYENLMIACNLIHEAHQAGIDRLLFLGSTCIYPREAPQPLAEASLLTGPLETTNEAYALAKICGIKLCDFYRKQYGRHYISAMPTNLYGPGDNYHPDNSHVIPALFRRFSEAREQNITEVTVWGTGSVQREFLYVDDLAEGCLFLLESYDAPGPVNVGSHEELTIRELAQKIARITDYRGTILYDPSKPDGTPRKKSDLRLITSLGWEATTPLDEGLLLAYHDYLQHHEINAKTLSPKEIKTV